MSASSSTPSWTNFLSKICFLESLSGIGISILINRSENHKNKTYGELQREKLPNFTLHYLIPYGNDDPYIGLNEYAVLFQIMNVAYLFSIGL